MKKNSENKLIVFQNKAIRRVWDEEEWWFSVVDIIGVLTDSTKPRDYWYRMKKRVLDNSKIELSTNCRQFKMKAVDGKIRQTECSNTEGIFRIIQSIPSPKAEPFKQWLAKVGYERIQEIEDPALAAERARQYYRDLGYDERWIETRLKSIEERGKLTDEWGKRGVKAGLEYAILTAEIARATFGLSPKEHKTLKQLDRENLRDHMTDLELIFTMLGEATTREQTKKQDAQGFDENKTAAKVGGKGTGDALKALEKTTGLKVISDKNFKKQIAEAKKKKKLDK